MTLIDLKYGESSFRLEVDEGRFEVIGGEEGTAAALSDAELGQRLDTPIGSPPLEDLVRPGETVLLVVPDATRMTACGQVVNLLVRRLIANGTAVSDVAIIFATGIHRRVTDAEKEELLTPFIAQRVRTLDHDAHNPIKQFRIGETAGGIPVELNWALTEFDHTVLIGGVAFHYFAGFTGGRKLICPGLASARTVSDTHRLAFDFENRGRRSGVGAGMLDGNPVNEAFTEAAALVNPSFAISTIVNPDGAAAELFCGDWRASHRSACEAYAAGHVISIQERRDVVVVSCGGYPHDINMIQAHKALEAASLACRNGGTIILFAECRDGLGRGDFLDWFTAGGSREIAEMLCVDYQVNGQTAWSLRKITERFDVILISNLEDAAVQKMGMRKADPARAAAAAAACRQGYVLPAGARFRVRLEEKPAAGDNFGE